MLGVSRFTHVEIEPRLLGLGLYIARGIATAHGGDITVESDEGETFFQCGCLAGSRQKLAEARTTRWLNAASRTAGWIAASERTQVTGCAWWQSRQAWYELVDARYDTVFWDMRAYRRAVRNRRAKVAAGLVRVMASSKIVAKVKVTKLAC